MKQPIGVIDSGVGGLNILKQLEIDLPHEDFVYLGDNLNSPYGEKSQSELITIGLELIEKLKTFNVKLVVIACNTLSLNAIDFLRAANPDLVFLGIARPTCKRFLNADKKNVLILATKATIKSNGYYNFIMDLSHDVTVYQQEAPKFVPLIEQNNLEHIDEAIKEYVDPYINKIDSIILGCTHYPIIKAQIGSLYPQLELFDSSYAVSDLVQNKLIALHLKTDDLKKGTTKVYTTGDKELFYQASNHFYHYSDNLFEFNQG